MTKANGFDVAFIHFLEAKEFDFDLVKKRMNSNDGLSITIEGVHLDPAAIMRVLLTKGELAKMSDPNYDYFDDRIEVKGDLKGGKQGDRDKHFGKSADFWKWWHLKEKTHSGGMDISSQAEADGPSLRSISVS